jgi:hypothetical protein
MALMGDDKKAARHKAALQLAVDQSGYGKKKLPAGTAWGVAVHESFESVVAYVVEAKITGKGKDRRPVAYRRDRRRAHRAQQRSAQGHGRTRRAAAGTGVRECDCEADGAEDGGDAV